MRFSRIVAIIALMIVGLSLARPTAAEEKIARLEVVPQVGIAFYLPGATNHCREDNTRCVFIVYTKQEIDAKEAAGAKEIKSLRELVTELQKNIKVLSDTNDALTKRLEDAEKRLGEKR
jgi:uncharacterized coiled-coil protein SlyX